MQAGIGLVVVLGGVAVVYNDPRRLRGRLHLHPAPVRDRLARRLRAARARRAGRGGGARVRSKPSASARQRRAIAVAEERARIARELHDIVAHAVSVMVLQVGAVRHKLPGRARGGRRGAPRRRAHRPLRARRDASPPRRDATDGDDLELTPAAGPRRPRRAAGRGRPRRAPRRAPPRRRPLPVPRAIDLSAYRIIQEGLTNALKHATRSDADVTLRYEPGEFLIEVRDNGRGSGVDRRARPRARGDPRAREDLRRRDDDGDRGRRRVRPL